MQGKVIALLSAILGFIIAIAGSQVWLNGYCSHDQGSTENPRGA